MASPTPCPFKVASLVQALKNSKQSLVYILHLEPRAHLSRTNTTRSSPRIICPTSNHRNGHAYRVYFHGIREKVHEDLLH